MVQSLVPLFGPVPGGMEMVVILLIAVLLFGANKIPKLARSTGQAMGEFQRGREEIEQELEDVKEDATVDTESTLGESDDSVSTTDVASSNDTTTTETESTTDES